MNERTLRPGNVAAAAVVIGGVLVLALPQHAMSIVRLVLVTVAAGTGLYALALNAPATWWLSPFDRRRGAGSKGDASAEIDWIRSTMSGRRQRIENGSPLPPETLRLLRPLIRVALEREGVDPGDRTHPDSGRRPLSARTWAVLNSEPLEWRPRSRTLRADRRRTAEAVHAILDELDRLGASIAGDVAHSPRGVSPRVDGGVPSRRAHPQQQAH